MVSCAAMASVSARGNIAVVGSEGGLDAVGVRGDRLTEVGGVEHREVGAFASRDGDVCGVAEQRDAGRAGPAVAVGELVDAAQDRWGLCRR